MVVATTVGSGPDNIARVVGTRLSELLGQQVVIDNRAGASGLIGAEIVAKAAPDGHTLWIATMTQLISSTLFERLHLAKTFAPVGMIATTPYVIASSTALPVNTISELVAHAKQRPAKVLYGSAGVGSTPHLCMEMFAAATSVKMTHVPYKSSSLVLTDMLSGQIQVTCAAAPAMPAFVKSGKVRMLGVSTETPTPLAAGLIPIREAVPGFNLLGWYGVLAPKSTPATLIARLNGELERVLRESDMQQRLQALGAEAAPSSPKSFGAFLDRETERWAKLLRDADIRPQQ
jgi:tripartite-type tricarboxylate transporter receptor subunit TctC